MASNEYQNPVAAKIIEKLQDEGPTQIKRWYNGDVLLVPKPELPICSVAKANTRISNASNAEDEALMAFEINVLYDYTKDLNQSSRLVAGHNSLEEICEKRDTNYQLLAGSIAYVLRKYQKLDNNLFLALGPGEVVEFNYGLGIDRRGPGIWSVEAVCRVNARLVTLKVS